MEDALANSNNADGERTASTPPPPPDPSRDARVTPAEPAVKALTNEPLRLTSEQWDISSVSAVAALRMFIEALDNLAEATGDVPPTPPVSRPTTPRPRSNTNNNNNTNTPSRFTTDATASSGSSTNSPENPPPITIGSPEAHPHEPIGVTVGANAQALHIQHAAIARRFFSKLRPPFSIGEYLTRLHQWCAHSAGVYLAAASYVQRLCVSEASVPATHRTIHRLALAAIRVAAKALEDNKWPQERVAKVGGVSLLQLMNLEVTLCFLLDFDLWVDEKVLSQRVFLLQQAGRQGTGVKGKVGEGFQLKLPILRKKPAIVAAT